MPQMNLFMKKADQEPKIKTPASIQKEADEMLEPEEKKNMVVVNRPASEKCPKCGGDLEGGETGCCCEKKASNREIQLAKNPKWEGNVRRPSPPAGYAPLKLLGQYANQHVCPNCGIKGAGIVGDGGGFQDTEAQKFYEYHCGDGSYEALCKQFGEDMIKCHWSRFGTGYFTCCKAKIWHDMVDDQLSGKWKESRHWRYYYLPSGQKDLALESKEGGGNNSTGGQHAPTGSLTESVNQKGKGQQPPGNDRQSLVDMHR